MKCPECGKDYPLHAFGRDEVYFECDACSVELVIDQTEQVELMSSGRAYGSSSQNVDSQNARSSASTTLAPSPPNLVPMYLWIGFLGFELLIAVYEIIVGLRTSLLAVASPGFVVTVALFGSAFFGVIRKKRFGLYLTYIILILSALVAIRSMVQPLGTSTPYTFGSFVGSLVFVAILALWLRWFWTHSWLFGRPVTLWTPVTDVYSEPPPREDVQQAIEPERAQRT